MTSRRWWRSIACLAMVAMLTVQLGCQPEEPAETPAEPNTPATEPATDPPAADPNDAADKPASPMTTVSATTTTETPLVKVPLGLPPLPVPEDNPLTADKIALGKKLYFDKRLSKDGTISCATCHDPKMAWTEHLATSKGINDQVGGANSPTVINSAYADVQFWDGRSPDLEDQALGPIENPIEMGHDLKVLVEELAAIPEYEADFQKVFGTTVTSDGIAKAIASFERTVLSGNSPYDQYLAGDKDAMTEAQIRGMDLFDDYNCSVCHTQPLFSNYKYYNAGVGMDKTPPDAGRMAVTEKEKDLGKFRVPPLREVENTGPYYHDGSVATLEEAVAIMAGGGKDNANLSILIRSMRDHEISEQDQKDIVEFLKALSGEFPGEDG